MLITFKTLQQKTFQIEIDENEKVSMLKAKIADERGKEFPKECQKLIYAGKILDDEKPISEYKIDPVKNFVVVMAVKPKAKPVAKSKETVDSQSATSSRSPVTLQTLASTAEATSAGSTTTSETVSEAQPSTTETTSSTTETTSSTTETTTTPSTTATTPATTSAESSLLLTGSELEASITELMSLGYSRERVMQALNSSFHNADRAAEYLLSGNIPDISEGEPSQDDAPTAPSVGTSQGGAPDSLDFLRNLPQFQMMRSQLQGRPELLPQLLQEIGRENPQLLALISQNQEAFISLLNESAPPAGDNSAGSAGGAANPVQQAQGGGFQIQVTPEEKAAIDRILLMGFPESEVIQAYFACDKNEQLAVEFLLKED